MQHIAKLEAQRGNPSLDLVILDQIPNGLARQKDLLAPFDERLVPNLAKIYDFAKMPGNMGVGVGASRFGLGYNEKVFKEKGLAPLTSLEDLFRPELKGKIVLLSPTNTLGVHFLVMMAYLNGGNEKNIDAGFQKVAKLAPHVVEFVNAVGEQINLLQQGVGWVGFWDDTSLYTAVKGTGMPLVMPWLKEGHTEQVVTLNLVKGAKNAKLAQELVNFILSDTVQAKMAKEVLFGPVNRDAKLDPETAAMVVSGPEQMKKLIAIDIDYVNQHRPAWIERFSKEIARKR